MKISALAICAVLLAANAVQAEECKLIPRAVFTFQNTGGMLTVPVTISGKTYPFAVAFGSTYSAVAPGLIDELHLARRDLPVGITLHIGDAAVKDRVTLPDIGIGASRGKDFEMLEMPFHDYGGTVGFLGMDVLNDFDVELDLKANAMRLFAQDHCPGQVVYWAKNYGQMPIKTDPDGSFYLDGVLDGKKTSAVIDIERDEATMGFSDARDLAGFAKNDPKLVPVGDAKEERDREFRYPFGTLALGDLAVKNPQIVLYPQTPDEQCRIAPKGLLLPEPEAFARYAGPVCLSAKSLILGRNVLKQLRLYFAFKERNLYLTPGSPGVEDIAPEMSILKSRATH